MIAITIMRYWVLAVIAEYSKIVIVNEFETLDFIVGHQMSVAVIDNNTMGAMNRHFGNSIIGLEMFIVTIAEVDMLVTIEFEM